MSSRKQGRDPSTSAKRPRRVEAVPPPGTLTRAAVPFSTARVFAPPILIGALLLFAVQPLIARYLLPWFGGGPGVWATCMLFFQALLLGGYLYAHLSVRRLATRGQIVLHLALLGASLAMIPIIPAARWKPEGAADPIGRILLLLAVTIGLPYFVLSATSPLLQAWFVRVRPATSPYRLFALSNLGSLLALLGYPAILEPFFTRRQQAWIWSGGLILFTILCIACAAHVWKRATPLNASDEPLNDPAALDPGASRARLVLWLALPMVASVLLLATTNTLTEDVAAFPLLWVIPLTLYLLTFVIAFDSPRWYPRRVVLVLLPLATLWIFRLQWLKTDVTLLEQFVGYLVGMFVLCLFCHGELARLKPDPRHLTGYYLAIAVGGALGGVFVALVAPRVFDRLLELPLGIAAAAGLAFLCVRQNPVPHGARWAAPFGAAALLVVIGVPALDAFFDQGKVRIVERSRNFYGTLTVSEGDAGGRGDPADLLRELKHGTTSHGAQFLAPARRTEPTLYYRVGSGVSYALHFFPRPDHRHVGLVGLGAGTLAAYGKPGDMFRFYEINPDVERLAHSHFSFLADTPAETDVVLGDARLTLEREQPAEPFDVLVLDAFSGDAIPTHLLTTEAFDLYRRRVKDDGIIAVHISNRSVDLIQVVLRQAERLGMRYAIINDHDRDTGRLVSRWMLITNNDAFLKHPAVLSATRLVQPNPEITAWSDDHINLMQVIRWVPNAPPVKSR